MILMLSATSDIGCVRTNNEDMVLVKDEFIRDGQFTGELETNGEAFFVAVSDGMGGHNAGELASEYVLHRMAAVASGLESEAEGLQRQLDGSIQEIHASLNAMGMRDPAIAGLGCTFTGVLFRASRVYSVHIGDSRLYRMRGPFLSQLTRDHTVANMLGGYSGAGNPIVNCFGGGAAGIFFDLEDLTERLMPGDRLLLCSDGLTGEVADEQISRALSEGAGTGDLAEAAKAAGGRDNVSCVLMQLRVLLCLVLSLVMGRAGAQGTKTSMTLCQMAARAGRTAAEKAEIAKDYALMLGITEDLGRYRQEFLDSPRQIDLFPTAYYHTTRNEMARIARDEYVYPIEKLRQMIAFYNAYKRNRVLWDQGDKSAVEIHWAQHFAYAENCTSRLYVGFVLASAIAAHVQCDLGRAIRYEYNHRYNPTLAMNDPSLLKDFIQTNPLFKESKANTLEDVKYAFNRQSTYAPSQADYFYTWVIKWFANYDDGMLVGGVNEAYQQYIKFFNFFDVRNIAFNDADVVAMRQQAYKKAMSTVVLADFSGRVLGPQPDYPADVNAAGGKNICAVRTYKLNVSATEEDVQASGITVNAGDEVMVFTVGTVHIGTYMGDADGKGLLHGHLTSGLYTKYKQGPLGCLTALQGGATAVCGKLDMRDYCVADHFGLSISPKGLLVDQYLSGLTFRATVAGPLNFDVNDTVKGDNGGVFEVYVFVRPGGLIPDPRIKNIE